ncbi:MULTISPECIES: hypothetical protein [Streptomyces]|uniref:Uncharacterized protein n=1 Tax=Streptomyces spororaveus TaxID=284039 RepID=A0ABQ3T4F1_9ACTN|nr:MULTISPECIES: hypothetical protein [Streptomyces]MCM9076928.1 hypothetical protein [Streptomyces spororaveus]MCX5308419.1 hypothetical protein [Streptomyces sp. NBC_00160]GHI75247.1 hypothetical protein Sspor_08080 [Streptomyces spororaveus]
MTVSPTVLVCLATAVLLSLIVALMAVSLTRWDGASLPTALARGGIAFGGTLTLCCVVLAVLISSTR